MLSYLFRKQALENQRTRMYGEVFAIQPVYSFIITSIITIAVLAVCLMLVFGSYTRRESVRGYLVPEKGLIKVHAAYAGIISEKNVREGDFVMEGDILFTVRTSYSNENGEDLVASLVLEKKKQINDTNNKIQQEMILNRMAGEHLSIDISGIDEEKEQLEKNIDIQERLLGLSNERLVSIKNLLGEGYFSDSEYLKNLELHMDKQLYLHNVIRELKELNRQQKRMKKELSEIPTRWQSRMMEFNMELSELKQDVLELNSQRAYTIREPISGRLTTIQIDEGQAISKRMPVVSILPEGANLYAELYLPTRAAGFAKNGQAVLLRYGAFPYQHYGLYDGRISEVTKTILFPDEITIPLSSLEPVYRVRVTLADQFVQAYDKKFPLQAGMLLEADIILEERSLGQWLLKPIYALKGKS